MSETIHEAQHSLINGSNKREKDMEQDHIIAEKQLEQSFEAEISKMKSHLLTPRNKMIQELICKIEEVTPEEHI